jgi:hypothetical protein
METSARQFLFIRLEIYLRENFKGGKFQNTVEYKNDQKILKKAAKKEKTVKLRALEKERFNELSLADQTSLKIKKQKIINQKRIRI